MKKKIKKIYDKTINLWNKFINLKYVNTVFKVLPQNIFLFILFIISIFTILSFYNANKYKYYYYQRKTTDNVGEIISEPKEISFKNIELTGNPEQYCMTFATYGKTITSDYRYILYKNDEVITDVIFNGSILKDGEGYCFDIPTLNKDNVKEYKVVIAPINATPGNAITYYTDNSGEATMSFIEVEKEISVRNLVALIYAIIFLALNYFINKKKIKPEIFWLIISFVYIIFAMAALPPYQVPDEHIHFVNSVNLTQVDYTKNLFTQFDEKQMYVPEDYDCINYSLTQKLDKVNDFNDVLTCFKSSPKSWRGDWHISSKSKTGYIFAAIGYKIMDLFSSSPMLLFYSGRIMNTIISIILVFFAIKIAPKYKLILLSVASIPMFIQEMISYSYDSLLNSVCLFVIAIIIHMIYDKKVKVVPWTIALILCGIIITDIKWIYLPIFLFLLFVPNENFKNKKYIKWLYIIGVLLLSYLLGNLTRYLVEYDPNAVVEATKKSSHHFNREFIMENPLRIFSIAYHTVLYQSVFYLRSIYAFFGWFRYKFSDILIFAYTLYTLYICLASKKIETKIYKRIIVWIGILISFAAIFAAMYFGWSKPGLGYVEGVQGRYLIPLLIPFILLLMPKKEWFKEDEKINYTFINIMLLQFVLLLIFGYY